MYQNFRFNKSTLAIYAAWHKANDRFFYAINREPILSTEQAFRLMSRKYEQAHKNLQNR